MMVVKIDYVANLYWPLVICADIFSDLPIFKVILRDDNRILF